MTNWCLILVKGQPRPDRPAAIDLAENHTISIGRESGECDVCLDSTSFPRLISRLHCRLAAKENQVVLQDCSINGCSIDGAIVARRAVLSEGSTIVFGPRGSLTEFTYRLKRAADGDGGATRKRARAEQATLLEGLKAQLDELGASLPLPLPLTPTLTVTPRRASPHDPHPCAPLHRSSSASSHWPCSQSRSHR